MPNGHCQARKLLFFRKKCMSDSGFLKKCTEIQRLASKCATLKKSWCHSLSYYCRNLQKLLSCPEALEFVEQTCYHVTVNELETAAATFLLLYTVPPGLPQRNMKHHFLSNNRKNIDIAPTNQPPTHIMSKSSKVRPTIRISVPT